MLSDVSPWLVIMVIVFLGFILVVFNARRDSALRAAAYTLVLSVIFIYVLTAHLVPEIRKFHSLIPADCMVAEQPKVIAYHSKHGPIHFAVVQVNVSHIDCHGNIGNSIEITNSDGASQGWDAQDDEDICQTGSKIIDGASAYVKIENWYMMDGDERNMTVHKWEKGKKYFCWSDSTIPQYVTFDNDQDPSAIAYALACLVILIFLCHASGTFVLAGECCNVIACDPHFLRIDAATPVGTLKRMRGEYSEV